MRQAGIVVFTALLLAFVPVRPAAAYTYDHEVLPGETLGTIARAYRTTVAQIQRRNRLRGGRLRGGQKLKIVSAAAVPQRRRGVYIVQPGDTPAMVARRHKMTLSLFARLNPGPRGRRLRVGKAVAVVVLKGRPEGRVSGLVPITSGPGFEIRTPARAWGTTLTSTRLGEVFGGYAATYPEAPPVRVHDISLPRGGWLPPHASHQQGRDVDICYPLRARYAGVAQPAPEMLDPERAWFLIKRFIDTGDVIYVFVDRRLQRVLYEYAREHGESPETLGRLFEYPRRHANAVIRHDPGHKWHFHVRFRQTPPPAEPEA